MIVKVCGMRQPENIRAVEQAGADWIGLICYDLFAPFCFIGSFISSATLKTYRSFCQ